MPGHGHRRRVPRGRLLTLHFQNRREVGDRRPETTHLVEHFAAAEEQRGEVLRTLEAVDRLRQPDRRLLVLALRREHLRAAAVGFDQSRVVRQGQLKVFQRSVRLAGLEVGFAAPGNHLGLVGVQVERLAEVADRTHELPLPEKKLSADAERDRIAEVEGDRLPQGVDRSGGIALPPQQFGKHNQIPRLVGVQLQGAADVGHRPVEMPGRQLAAARS